MFNCCWHGAFGLFKNDFTIRRAHLMHMAHRNLLQMIHTEFFGGRRSSRVYWVFLDFSLHVNCQCPLLCIILPRFDRMHYTFAILEDVLFEKIDIEYSVIY
jgi:hypothetical protein